MPERECGRPAEPPPASGPAEPAPGAAPGVQEEEGRALPRAAGDLAATAKWMGFAAAGTGRVAPVWPTFPLSQPSLNGFTKSKRCFNHMFTLLEIMSLDS